VNFCFLVVKLCYRASQNGCKKIRLIDGRATNRLLGFSIIEQLLTGRCFRE